MIYKCLIIISFASLLSSGCGHVRPPSHVSPSPHPMLDSRAWLPPRHTTLTAKRGRAELPPKVGPGVLQAVRLQVAKNLDALKPTELREVTRSLDLVRAAFAHTPQRDALGKVRTAG